MDVKCSIFEPSLLQKIIISDTLLVPKHLAIGKN